MRIQLCAKCKMQWIYGCTTQPSTEPYKLISISWDYEFNTLQCFLITMNSNLFSISRINVCKYFSSVVIYLLYVRNVEYFMIMPLLVGTLEEILEVIMTTNYTIHNLKMCSQLKLWFEINIVYVIYASGWNVSLLAWNKRARHVCLVKNAF